MRYIILLYIDLNHMGANRSRAGGGGGAISCKRMRAKINGIPSSNIMGMQLYVAILETQPPIEAQSDWATHTRQLVRTVRAAPGVLHTVFPAISICIYPASARTPPAPLVDIEVITGDSPPVFSALNYWMF